MYNRAKEVTLAQVLRGFPNVRNATVMIDATNRRAFGDAARQPSATVNLQTKSPGDKPSKKLINGAAATVAGAVSGLQRSRINVVIDGASYNVADNDPENGGMANGDSWMDLLKEGERHFSQKVMAHLGRINGVMVSVSVDPKMDIKRIEREVFDKANTFDKVIQTSEKTSESTNSSRVAGEPGAVPNAAVTGGANQRMDLAAGGAAGGGREGSSTNDAENTARMQVFPAVMREWIRSPAGAAAVTGASVTIPRSHFVHIFKSINPSAAEPDQATLDPIIKLELPKLKAAVLGCLGQVAAEKIAVDWYYDYMPTTGGDPAAPAAATSVPLALAGHAKEIALGGLALVSLFMVMMMVRKSAPPTIVVPKPERPAPVAPPPTDVAGEVGEGTQSMEAMEVDDESIRTTQIISQVSSLVKENPDAAANLVKRWLNRS
jgi:flagellar biosynthesis/type III secretory pathway M-ring protein FliF/YscJ